MPEALHELNAFIVLVDSKRSYVAQDQHLRTRSPSLYFPGSFLQLQQLMAPEFIMAPAVTITSGRGCLHAEA